jgi:hypothetical protein
MTTASKDWREVVAPDEDERFGRYARALGDLQAKRAAGKTPLRALHAKALCGARATLEVLGDLPEHARHGLFASPVTYQAYARFSNGAGSVQSDKRGDVRALAIKVLGVPGKKIIPGIEDATTQDFLAVQSSVTPFKTPDEFVAFVRAAANPRTLLPNLIRSVGFFRALSILRRLAKGPVTKPVATMAGVTFYSAAPIRVGPFAARYALAPRQATVVPVPHDRDRDYLARDLATRLRDASLAWDLRLQFFESEARTPIEDSSVDWDTPYVTVARLTVSKQDVSDAEGKKTAELVETLSFDTWHALVEHTPLGAMMRARKHAYYASITARGAAPEPGDASA